jgi:hypothetical protein
MNNALAGLLETHAVDVPGPWQIIDAREPPDDAGDVLTLAPGELLTEPDLPELTVPLLAWRHQRRFVELKHLIDEETVAPLLMCRFACLTDGQQMPMRAILYREFDLIEWLSGKPIVGIYASMADGRAANVIVRLAGGVIGSVEASATFPDGATMQDRHEMIARRGVASDRVVDTQVAQSSVYAWSADGHRQYTDVDAELSGLDMEQAALVRSAYQIMCEPELVPTFHERHRRLWQLVELACESDRRRERLTVNAEGGPV